MTKYKYWFYLNVKHFQIQTWVTFVKYVYSNLNINHIGWNIVSVLGRDEGYTVKYNPSPEGVPEGEARRNSWSLLRTVYYFNNN